MLTPDDITTRTDEVAALLAERLGARGRDLPARLAHVRRQLPRDVARAARELAQAQGLAGNPKLLRMVDPARLTAAHALVTAHLRAIDPARRRTTALLRLLARLALNLLLLAALVAALWAWRNAPPG
jgi:hypothetical protein